MSMGYLQPMEVNSYLEDLESSQTLAMIVRRSPKSHTHGIIYFHKSAEALSTPANHGVTIVKTP